MTRLRPVSLVLLCVLSSACDHDEPVSCTAAAVPSVKIKVVDGRGVPCHARVTFTVDEGPERRANCLAGQSPQYPCDLWTAGMEEMGRFVITVTSPQGTSMQSQHLLITRDECHVRTQSLTFTLPD